MVQSAPITRKYGEVPPKVEGPPKGVGASGFPWGDLIQLTCFSDFFKAAVQEMFATAILQRCFWNVSVKDARYA